MSDVTLELVKARHTELGAMIETLERSAQTKTLRIPAIDIQLRPGEWYAGAVLNEDGGVKHHTVVALVHESKLTFDATQKWAQEQGYSAPTRQEARLIVAHKYSRLDSKSYFWTCELHENSACAWYCNLSDGHVGNYARSAELGAVAVRRVSP